MELLLEPPWSAFAAGSLSKAHRKPPVIGPGEDVLIVYGMVSHGWKQEYRWGRPAQEVLTKANASALLKKLQQWNPRTDAAWLTNERLLKRDTYGGSVYGPPTDSWKAGWLLVPQAVNRELEKRCVPAWNSESPLWDVLRADPWDVDLDKVLRLLGRQFTSPEFGILAPAKISTGLLEEIEEHGRDKWYSPGENPWPQIFNRLHEAWGLFVQEHPEAVTWTVTPPDKPHTLRTQSGTFIIEGKMTKPHRQPYCWAEIDYWADVRYLNHTGAGGLVTSAYPLRETVAFRGDLCSQIAIQGIMATAQYQGLAKFHP